MRSVAFYVGLLTLSLVTIGSMGCAELMVMHMMSTPTGQEMIRRVEIEGAVDNPGVEAGVKTVFFVELRNVTATIKADAAKSPSPVPVPEPE